MGDPENYKGPSGANFGRILQPEPCIPSWNEILGNSGRVPGGRLGSNVRGLGLRWRVSIGGSTEKNSESHWRSPRPIKLWGAKRRSDFGGPPLPLRDVIFRWRAPETAKKRVIKTPKCLPSHEGFPGPQPGSWTQIRWTKAPKTPKTPKTPQALSGGGRRSGYIGNQAQLERKTGGLKCDPTIKP